MVHKSLTDMYNSRSGEGSGLANVEYVQWYCRACGATGEWSAQCVVDVRSSLALFEMLHAGFIYRHVWRTLAILATDCTSMIQLGDGIVEVAHVLTVG